MDLIKINVCFAFLCIVILSTILPATGNTVMTSATPEPFRYGSCPRRTIDDCSTPGTPCRADSDCALLNHSCCKSSCNDQRCIYAQYFMECPYADAPHWCNFIDPRGFLCCANANCTGFCLLNGEEMTHPPAIAPLSSPDPLDFPSATTAGELETKELETTTAVQLEATTAVDPRITSIPDHGDPKCFFQKLDCFTSRFSEVECRRNEDCLDTEVCCPTACNGSVCFEIQRQPRYYFSPACPYTGYCSSSPIRYSCYLDSECQQGLTCCRYPDCYATQCVDTSLSTTPTTTTATQLPSTSSTIVETTTAQVAPTTGKTKPGECPADRIGKKDDTDVDCRTDFDCEGKLKCCPKAEKMVCRLSDTVVPGSCPKVKQKASGKPSKSTCDSDYECSSKKKKCCQTETGGFICQIIQ